MAAGTACAWVAGGVEVEVEVEVAVEVARRVAWVVAAVVEESALRASDLSMDGGRFENPFRNWMADAKEQRRRTRKPRTRIPCLTYL